MRAPWWVRDAAAGAVAAIVLIANIVSFAALMFPGPLVGSVPSAIWAMLIGSGVSGLWIAWRSSIPPLATSIDSPTGAALVGLSATVGPGLLAAGASAQAAGQTVMWLFSAATLLSGALLWVLGWGRRGALLRFVPHFVSAGFLAATGWLLIAGGVRMATGAGPARLLDGLDGSSLARLLCALAVLGAILALRRYVKSALVLPGALLVMTLGGAIALHALHLSDPRAGWYLPSIGTLTPWWPLGPTAHPPLDAGAFLAVLPELFAVAIVALVSLVTKVSSLEIARKTSGDLDTELRAHGLGTFLIAPLGGWMGSLQIGSSRLLEQAGGVTRASGVACALVLLSVGLTGFDLPSLVPLPVATGLVFFLGWGFLVEALAKPLARREPRELLLVVAIMVACIRYGFLVGVLGGIAGACALFAVSYARTGVVRQHLSRTQFAGNVGRPEAALRYLGEHGEAIQLYWLAGYLFFGSSEGLLERLRTDLAARAPRQVGYVVLDFRMVSGADASGILGLGKLRHHCQRQGVTLVFSSVPKPIVRMLERDALLGAKGQAPAMPDVHAALAWCEERLLEAAPAGVAVEGTADFEAWLQQQLGSDVRAADLLGYLQLRHFEAPTVLYREGEPSDAIDLVVTGRLVVEIVTAGGKAVRVRTITNHTAVGEMGFFRGSTRSATVATEGTATLYTLTRVGFERMRRERPELAMLFVEFMLRMLAERLVVTERTAAALGT